MKIVCRKLLFSFFLIIIGMLCSCINGDYDLSNLSAKLRANNLTVPVNVDTVSLDYVLDFDDDDQIEKIGDEYVFHKTGSYESDSIHVKTFTVHGTTCHNQSDLKFDQDPSGKLSQGGSWVATAQVPYISNDIDMKSDKVNDGVVDVEKVGFNASIAVTISYTGLKGIFRVLHMKDVQIQLVPGMELVPDIGTYNPENGVLTIPNAVTDENHELIINIKAKGADVKKSGMKFEDHVFSLQYECYTKGGEVQAYSNDLLSTDNVPRDFYVDVATKVGDLEINEVTATVEYHIDTDKFDIDPINIGTLPSILNKTGTNLSLTNPQVYARGNNPLWEAGYHLSAESGVAVTGNVRCETEPGAIVADRLMNTFCISPKKPDHYYLDWDDIRWVSFPAISEILSGYPLPKQLEIEAIDPFVPEQRVENFKLGTVLNPVHGEWEVFAPLALTDSSAIKYSKEWTDWEDDTLDKLVVENAVVSANLTTDIPVAVNVTVTFLGKEGTLTGTTQVKGDVTNAPISITLDGGPISEIYGMRIDARAAGMDKSLRPSQTVVCNNVKVKVNGYYETDL